MWVTVIVLVLLCAIGAVLLLIGNVLYAILEELRDQTTAIGAMRPTAPWAGKMKQSTDALRRGTSQE